MKIKPAIVSQYRASLAMMEQAIRKCPDELWLDATYKNQFWHIAYHALFFTHLYLQPSESAFIPWAKRRENYESMGPTPWPPHEAPKIDTPYSKEELLEYCLLIWEQVAETVNGLDLAGESGFDWLPFGKLELQFYALRHLQLHTGELCERIWQKAGIEVDWIGVGAE